MLCRKQLADAYRTQQYDEADKTLLPLNKTKLISLKLVKDIGSKYRHKKTVESIDDVIGDKQELAFKNIFEDFDSDNDPIFTLIIGRPGSGKTTLMNKVSIDWADEIFPSSKLIILVHLRKLNALRDHSIENIIITACPNMKLYQDELQRLVNYITELNGHGFVFVLDGLDEYLAQEPHNQDFIFSLMKRKMLKKSAIVVSSRPAASQDFYRDADKHIEVIGFQKPQVIEYIHCYFEDNKEKAQQLVNHLEDHVNLMNMCYLPLHCAMLSFLFADDDGCLPVTETEVYKHFTIATLLRFFYKEGSRKLIMDFDQLPPDYRSALNQICELAYNATIASKQVFKYSELVKGGLTQIAETGDICSDKSGMGLIVIDQYFSRYGHDEMYTFLHLTFQEYLSALHLITLSDSEQLDTIKMHLKSKHLLNVWRFFCGMMKFSSTSTMDAFKTLTDAPAEHMLIYGVQCANETQQKQACTSLLIDKFQGKIEIECKSVSPSDWGALSFVIKESGYHLKFLE